MLAEMGDGIEAGSVVVLPTPSLGRRVASFLWKSFCPRPEQRWVITAALFRAFVLWIGEVVVSMLPLLSRVIVTTYAKPVDGLSGSGWPPLVELNIATVVLSGLGLLVVFKSGIMSETSTPLVTPFTHLAAIIDIILLVGGALLYAITSMHMELNDANVTKAGLELALLMSLLLSLEQAWLAVLYGEGIPAGEKAVGE